MTNNMKQRILYWDVIKFFAILLVVYGHAIQNLNPVGRTLWDSFMETNILTLEFNL